MITYVLPAEIVQAIRADVPKNLQHYAFKVVGSVWLKYQREKIPLLEHTPIARNYVSELLGTRNTKNDQTEVGYKVIRSLTRAGIFQMDDSRSPAGYLPPIRRNGKKVKDGVCKSYRINPALTVGGVDLVELTDRRRTRERLSEIEAAARRYLEEVHLPFDTFAELAAWCSDYVQSPEIQKRITDRIEAGPSDPKFYPDSAHLLLGDGAEVILKPFILAYLRAGLRLYAYTSKTGRKTYYIARHADLVRMKTDQLQMAFTYQLAIINQVRQVDQVAHRNETNNRLDSPLTNLFSKLLALITVRGERLTGIDLSNSQFVLFAAILAGALEIVEKYPEKAAVFSNNTLSDAAASIARKPLLLEGSEGEGSLPKTHQSKVLFLLSKPLLSFFISYLCHIQHVTACKSDVQPCKKTAAPAPEKQRLEASADADPFADIRAFIRVCRAGQLYEYVAARKFFKRDLEDLKPDQRRAVDNIHRDQVKAAMFGLFFDRYHVDGWNEKKAADKAILSAVFPNVVGIVDHVKKSAVQRLKQQQKADPRTYAHLYTKDGKVQTPDKVGNAAFAVMLQRVESKVFVDGILRKCMRRYWTASKHDSILCCQSDFNRVLRVITAELDKYLGPGNYRLKRQVFELGEDGRPITKEEPITL